MANAVVYELRVEESVGDIRFKKLERATGILSDATGNLVAAKPSVIEVFVVNAPESEPANFQHFEKVYALFNGIASEKRRIPSPGTITARCEDPPGVWPVKCPGMQFSVSP